jgi:ABC-2 type transport system ATP-binding protein
MRMILGLDAPTAGSVTVAGRAYRDHPKPLQVLGALLEARAVHTSRSAQAHLRALAATHGIGARRVNEVIDLVGLHDVARRRAGGFSLGMGQRLGIASALLADPEILMLDEPVNGLDPEGIRWIRDLLKGLADEGRTIFVSSHLMSEMAQTAEHVIVVGRGRLIADVPIAELIANASSNAVHVRTPEPASLAAAVELRGAGTASLDNSTLEVTGMTAAEVGQLAHDHGIVLHELTPRRASLEDVFMDMTRDQLEYQASTEEAQAQA